MTLTDERWHDHMVAATNCDSVSEAPRAVFHYSKALELVPDSHEAQDILTRRAEARCRMGDHQGSILDAMQIIELDPSDPMGHFQVGTCYDHLGEYGAAIAFLDRAIELEPAPFHYLQRGIVRHHQGRDDEALLDFDLAITRWHEGENSCDTLGEIHCFRGLSHYVLRDYRSARDAFGHAMRHLPRDPEPHAGMALCYLADGHTTEVLRCVDHAFTLVPADSPLFSMLLDLRCHIETWKRTGLTTEEGLSMPNMVSTISQIVKDAGTAMSYQTELMGRLRA